MTFSVIAMVGSALYTVVDLIYYEQLKWIRQNVKPTVLLNFQLVAETGALNAQDSLKSSINQLKIAQSIFQQIIDEQDKREKMDELIDSLALAGTTSGDIGSAEFNLADLDQDGVLDSEEFEIIVQENVSATEIAALFNLCDLVTDDVEGVSQEDLIACSNLIDKRASEPTATTNFDNYIEHYGSKTLQSYNPDLQRISEEEASTGAQGDTQVFYTDPRIQSEEDEQRLRTDAQNYDHGLCKSFHFLLKDYL